MLMDQDMQSLELAELYSSLPKGVDSSHDSEDVYFVNGELRIQKTDMIDVTDAGNILIGSILRDDKAQFVSQSKRFLKNSPSESNSEDDQNRDDAELLDRTIVSKLLRLCCMFDSVECASALIGGDVVGIVPRVNEIDESGRSALHTAAEAHATRCIELLLRKHARTDLKSYGQSQLALELSLSSRRMDVVWTVDNPIEDLLICLNQKDLTAVRLLSEKTKEIAEVAYAVAMDGKAVSLAALLMVAGKKVTASIVEDLSSKKKTTIYDCVIREALYLSPAGSSQACASTKSSESSERRKLLLCEMELLQLYGALAQSGSKDKKVTSPLILASKACDTAVLQILLLTKIDMNEADAEGNSALHWSLKMSPSSVSTQTKTVCLLLNYGARVGQRNRLGLTALHIAAANGHLQALQILLLEDPGGVHATTETKETPLFFAVRNDYKDSVELLLQWGANSEVLNLRKQRPIDFAKSQDMRFILNPTNISFMNRPCSAQRKYTAVLHKDGIISETCESFLDMIDDDSTTEKIPSNMKTEICRYFESPGGCVRGAKCFYAHGEQELRPSKHGTTWFHFCTAELRRKIFVGGLPPSLDSESLSKYFEQFGLVEEANVIGVYGNQQQSRGFGFVTFKHEKSVEVALQAHYVCIMGKQVEIKSAVPKSLLLPELQESPPHPQKEEEQNSQQKAQTPSTDGKNADDCRHEQMSWADRLLRGQQKINKPQTKVSPTSVNQKEPAWLRKFMKWIPKFLIEASERLGEGEWYALSSLKGDFKTTCGFELDHASLGYSKLSDFMKSVTGICRMKIVPVGKRGPATHMVLLPNLAKPKKELVQPIKMPDTIASSKSLDESGAADADESKVVEDVLLVSSDKVSLLNTNLDGGYPIHEVPQKNLDTPVTVHPSFLQFLKPDPVFHARPWLSNERSGSTNHNWEIEGEGKLRNQQRHLVLEALARKQNNSSAFFLRDLDFFKNYKASIAQGKCFACSQRKIVWANFPCQHLLWCGECKVHAAGAAGTSEHKCVICDARVVDLVPRNENHLQVCYEVSRNKEFPPYDPNNIRRLSEKMRSPLLSH